MEKDRQDEHVEPTKEITELFKNVHVQKMEDVRNITPNSTDRSILQINVTWNPRTNYRAELLAWDTEMNAPTEQFVRMSDCPEWAVTDVMNAFKDPNERGQAYPNDKECRLDEMASE